MARGIATGRAIASGRRTLAAFLAVAHDTSPFFSVYQVFSDKFGSKLANPATLPAGNGNGIAFSPAGDYIAVAHAVAPFFSVFAFNRTTGVIGAKSSDPVTTPTGTGNDVAWSPAGDYVAVAHSTSPFFSVYPFAAGVIGTKLADPATLPTGTGNGIAFSPDGGYVAVAHTTSPGVSVYPLSGGALGTKIANPAVVPGNGNDVFFNAAGTYIGVTAGGTKVYPWSGSFGAKVTEPSYGILGGALGLRGGAWNPSNTWLLQCTTTTNGGDQVGAIAWSGAGFTGNFNVTGEAGPHNKVVFSPDGSLVAAANEDSFVAVWPFNNGVFGAKFANPATLPTGNGNGVAFYAPGRSIASGRGIAV